MAMENLSQRLLLADTNGKLDSYIIGGTKSVSHVIFVGDLLFFTKANKKSFETLKSIHETFSSYSSLNINQPKSDIYLSRSAQGRQDLLSIMKFSSKELLITHLGIPLVGHELREKDYKPLVNQLQTYLNNRAGRSLSSDGRIQLANWVLYGKLIYWFHGLNILVGVIKKMRSVIYRFI